jgi:anti-sigma factor RsiW
MTACKDFDLLLSLRAVGDIPPADAARLEQHLAACAACRAEASADSEVLRLARLPPPTEAERRAMAGLARETLAELHRREGQASSWKRAGAAFAAAAAVLVAVLAPAMLGRHPTAPPATEVATTASADAAWDGPDLDTLWSDAGILDDDATVTVADAASAAVVSVDFQ